MKTEWKASKTNRKTERKADRKTDGKTDRKTHMKTQCQPHACTDAQITATGPIARRISELFVHLADDLSRQFGFET